MSPVGEIAVHFSLQQADNPAGEVIRNEPGWWDETLTTILTQLAASSYFCPGRWRSMEPASARAAKLGELVLGCSPKWNKIKTLGTLPLDVVCKPCKPWT